MALRITDASVELIQKATGEVIVDLGTASRTQVLVWSPDSKWVAYGNRGDKEGDVSVYFWNGSTFQEFHYLTTCRSPISSSARMSVR